MPKPTKQVEVETVDATADAIEPETTEENGTPEPTPKERKPMVVLSEMQQYEIVRTMKKMRRGEIPGGVTPASVCAYLQTHPEFADIASQLTPSVISSRLNTLAKQRQREGRSLEGWPEFDRQHSPRVNQDELDALLAE